MELALLMPFIVGLIVLTLQGGILTSDQVHLEHFAYEGALWAAANPSTASADPGGAPGTGSIAQHHQPDVRWLDSTTFWHRK